MKVWYMCTTELYSVTKKNEIMNFEGKWVEVEKHYNEWDKLGMEKQTLYVLPMSTRKYCYLLVTQRNVL